MSMILIDMNIPDSCNNCPLNDRVKCDVTGKSWNWGITTRPSWCPIKTEVTDKDILAGLMGTLFTKDEMKEIVDKISNKGVI